MYLRLDQLDSLQRGQSRVQGIRYIQKVKIHKQKLRYVPSSSLFMNSHHSLLLSAPAFRETYCNQTGSRGCANVLCIKRYYNFNKLKPNLLKTWLGVELLFTTSFFAQLMNKGWLGRLQQGRKSWHGSTFKSKNGGTI